jgi:hypothetical protein
MPLASEPLQIAFLLPVIAREDVSFGEDISVSGSATPTANPSSTLGKNLSTFPDHFLFAN